MTCQENRKLLSGIVYGKKKRFTAEEIIAEYKAIQGNAIIDGLESIRGFLRGLVELGGLRPDGGGYVVV